jgi:hypothetical protein
MLDIDTGTAEPAPIRAYDAWDISLEQCRTAGDIAAASALMGHQFGVALRAQVRGKPLNLHYWRGLFARLHERRDALLQELAEAQEGGSQGVPGATGQSKEASQNVGH